MGTSVVSKVCLRNTSNIHAVIYLAPTAGSNILNTLRIAWNYRKKVALDVILGKANKPSFSQINRIMMNKTDSEKTHSIYNHMTYDSGKALREALLCRKDHAKGIPKLIVYGKNDLTIVPPTRAGINIVGGDHLSMVYNSKELVLKFIEKNTQ